MAKFYGLIGFVSSGEKADQPGVWEETVTERNYRGDISVFSKRWQSSESVIDNSEIDYQFSIIADPYAFQNFNSMRYIKWMGSKWKVHSVQVQRPRLILSIGGVYNGPSS